MTQRHGSKKFYELLLEMEDIHDRKSHDYANDADPFANYYFAGVMSKLFENPEDSGFVGRIAEKVFRLANIQNNNLQVKNESIEDTENDICVITALWVASRRDRRSKAI
jgi:hypothetical protein